MNDRTFSSKLLPTQSEQMLRVTDCDKTIARTIIPQNTASQSSRYQYYPTNSHP
jgi:hypothetical protein